MSFSAQYLAEVAAIVPLLDAAAIEKTAAHLARVRSAGGRVFWLGVGGSAANCAHAVNDLRKLAALECYAPTDNVAELTARINDEGWASSFAEWLKVSRLGPRDAVFVLSVGGGDEVRNVSPNLVAAIRYARQCGATVLGIVGRDGGFTAQHADAAIVIPTVNPAHVTPHTEAFQAVILHLLVTHPQLKVGATRWESLQP
jgi:D-sedoheptulose 7-phosphate isomerase